MVRTMTVKANTQSFLNALRDSLKDDSFIKITLGQYHGSEKDLKSAFARKVLIKRKEHLSYTYRYKTKDVVKNYELDDSIGQTEWLIGEGFQCATLFTSEFDLQLDGKKTKPTQEMPESLDHDKSKNRLIAPEGKYLQALSITDASGKVLKTSQDKYRQINRYVEILAPLIKADKAAKIVDMGSGKGYLTFALYDYLVKNMGLASKVVGVEFREDMVNLCNKIAKESGFDNLSFEQGTIENYNAKDTDILIALHACDTATDDAIAKGIKAEAELIVVAPCCHKQIRREIEAGKVHNDLDFLVRHGIFMERQAEMVTDGIRALILEYFGYSVKVFEFISDAHTPKNVMIVGTKNIKSRNEKILQKIKDAKTYFGIGQHHLEKILDI